MTLVADFAQQGALHERERALSERLSALELFEALLHQRRRRLCAQLIALVVIESHLGENANLQGWS